MTEQGTSGAPRGLYKKLITDPLQVVDEALEGFVGAHSGLGTFAGYVGRGFADAAACGIVFCIATPEFTLDAIRPASPGPGVTMGYGNYAGDGDHGVTLALVARQKLDKRSPVSADPGATSFAIVVDALVGRGERVSALVPTPRRVDA